MTKRSLFLFAVLAGCGSFAVMACGSSEKPAPAGSTTGSPEDASIDRAVGNVGEGGTDGGDASDGATSCAVPALGGATITGRLFPGTPPPDTGGTIVAGTYDLTGLDVYLEDGSEGDDAGVDGGAAPTARATFVITSDSIALSGTASPVGGGAPNVTMFVAKQHVSDVFLVIDESCPATDSVQTPFSATTTTITLHTAQRRQEIYTRRP